MLSVPMFHLFRLLINSIHLLQQERREADLCLPNKENQPKPRAGGQYQAAVAQLRAPNELERAPSLPGPPLLTDATGGTSDLQQPPISAAWLTPGL